MLGGFVMRLYRFLALFQVLCKIISLHRNNILVPSRAFTEPTILAVRAILYAIATLTALLSCKSTDPDIPLDRTHNFTKIIAMEQPFLSLHSEDGPQKVPVADKPVTIGRHPDNLLVITDTQASRFHAVIGRSKDGFVVKDLDSRNGTRLNGQPVKAATTESLLIVGTAFTYLQDFLPHVAQAAVREGWVDSVGLGRMVLSYPELPADVLAGVCDDRKLRVWDTVSQDLHQ